MAGHNLMIYVKNLVVVCQNPQVYGSTAKSLEQNNQQIEEEQSNTKKTKKGLFCKGHAYRGVLSIMP